MSKKFSGLLLLVLFAAVFIVPAGASLRLIKVFYDSSYNNIIGESGNAVCPKWGSTSIYYVFEDCP